VSLINDNYKTKSLRSFSCDIKKQGKWHHRVKSWVIFIKG
jgi:hypothetical protein